METATADPKTQESAKPKAKRAQLPAVARPSSAVAERSARGLVAALIDAAGDPNCNAEKARALFDLWKDVKASEASEAFTRDFIALQRELPTIRPDGKIEIKELVNGKRTGPVQQSTPYATFQNIMRAIKPKLIAHNFALSFSTEPELAGGRLIVRGVLDHAGGHSRSTAFPLPIEDSGSKNNVQGWGSSMSYGKRYATIALLNIVSYARADQDADGNTGNFKPKAGGGLVDVTESEKVTAEQAAQLRKKIADCKVPMDKVRQIYGITNMEELPANLVSAVIKKCDDYTKAAAERQRG